MARARIDMLRARHQIAPLGSKHQLLTAFYLGSIEGEIRKQVRAEMTLREMGDFALGVALYTAQKDGVIATDNQWVSLATEYQQFYMSPEHHEYRLLGIKYAGVGNHDSEAAWAQLEKLL